MTFGHDNPPPGYAPCTRPWPHEGPCAHPFASSARHPFSLNGWTVKRTEFEDRPDGNRWSAEKNKICICLYDDQEIAIFTDYDEEPWVRIEVIAELMRRAGWTVTPPGEKT